MSGEDALARSLGALHLDVSELVRQAEAEARARVTFEAVSDRYLAKAKTRLKPRSYEELERNITKQWAGLRGWPIHKVERALVASRLEEIATHSGPIASNRARPALSALFTWAMGMGLAEANPVAGTMRVADEPSRSHVIADAELRA